MGPILFKIYVDDIDDKVTNKVLKFADDLKMMCLVNSDVELKTALNDLKEIIDWAERWGMKLNIPKCRVMHYYYYYYYQRLRL